jgi:hypothetical protein
MSKEEVDVVFRRHANELKVKTHLLTQVDREGRISLLWSFLILIMADLSHIPSCLGKNVSIRSTEKDGTSEIAQFKVPLTPLDRVSYKLSVRGESTQTTPNPREAQYKIVEALADNLPTFSGFALLENVTPPASPNSPTDLSQSEVPHPPELA